MLVIEGGGGLPVSFGTQQQQQPLQLAQGQVGGATSFAYLAITQEVGGVQEQEVSRLLQLAHWRSLHPSADWSRGFSSRDIC